MPHSVAVVSPAASSSVSVATVFLALPFLGAELLDCSPLEAVGVSVVERFTLSSRCRASHLREQPMENGEVGSISACAIFRKRLRRSSMPRSVQPSWCCISVCTLIGRRETYTLGRFLIIDLDILLLEIDLHDQEHQLPICIVCMESTDQHKLKV